MNHVVLSIITVNFNNNAGLIKTLQSVEAQSYASYEHIIIDAGSTDGSVQTIKDYRQQNPHLTFWVSEPDHGIYDGMNKGISRARGEYLYFLNSGDCLEKDILREIPFDGTKLIYGDALFVGRKKTEHRIPPTELDLIYLCNNSLPHQSCFIHRALFEERLYDTRYRIISDWAHHFISLIMERCSYRYVPFLISVCDGNGVSSDWEVLDNERKRWFREQFPGILSNSFLACGELDESGFRPVVSLLSRTRKFKIRMRKLVLLLYRINSAFSKR